MPRGQGREARRVVDLDACERREGREGLARIGEALAEVRGEAEGEGRVEAPVVREAEAADLLAQEDALVRGRQRRGGGGEAELTTLVGRAEGLSSALNCVSWTRSQSVTIPRSPSPLTPRTA